MVILVTGANGQLGQALQLVSRGYPDCRFIFCSSDQLDICNAASIEKAFTSYAPDYCINAAAYTAVDKAESEREQAYNVNVNGPELLAKACKLHGATLIHISTDFVFDGLKTTPYTEMDKPDPQSVYGKTKLQGEQAIQRILSEHYIVRTSWVYSQFGNNFYKTMLRLGQERSSISVVNDQVGTPTNAVDLADALVRIAMKDATLRLKDRYGIYNYSNEGQCSWYDFAKKIFEIHKIQIDLQPIPTSDYPTPATRPTYSVLDKSKIRETFDLEIKEWSSQI
jgi:dTDP-4-dehydrorhamnose reductase